MTRSGMFWLGPGDSKEPLSECTLELAPRLIPVFQGVTEYTATCDKFDELGIGDVVPLYEWKKEGGEWVPHKTTFAAMESKYASS